MFNRLLALILLLGPAIACAQIVVIGPGGGAPPPSTSGVKPVLQAIVIDALGRPVGSTTTFFTGPANVFIEVQGRFTSLLVMKNGIMSNGPGLYFTTPDCSGTAYITPDLPEALIQPSVIGPPGKSLYVPKAGAIPQIITVVAQIVAPYVGPPACLLIPPPPVGPPTPLQLQVVPAEKSVDLNQYFLPPFSIRTQ